MPNVPHAELTVIPEDEWQKDKDLYVYSAWVRKTLELLKGSAPDLAKAN